MLIAGRGVHIPKEAPHSVGHGRARHQRRAGQGSRASRRAAQGRIPGALRLRRVQYRPLRPPAAAGGVHGMRLLARGTRGDRRTGYLPPARPRTLEAARVLLWPGTDGGSTPSPTWRPRSSGTVRLLRGSPADLAELTAARPFDAEGVRRGARAQLHLREARGARPWSSATRAISLDLRATFSPEKERPDPAQGRGCSGSGTVSPSPEGRWSSAAAAERAIVCSRPPDSAAPLRSRRARAHSLALDEVDELQGFVGLDWWSDPVEAGPAERSAQ